MIDIHCHLLPGVDDGAATMEESMEMAKKAVKEGIKIIIATPHHKNHKFENPKESILKKVSDLNQNLREKNIPLKVLPGQEPAINGEFLIDYEQGELLTLNKTHYLFIELPSGHVPRYTEKVLMDLQYMGIVPIIVHPERNQGFIERPEVLYQLINKGALAQVTASSVCGGFGKNIKRFSNQLIEANLVHFIASDAHNTYNRKFHMSEAYQNIESSFGIDTMFLFKENAELLIKGMNVYKEAPQQVRRRRIFGIF